MLEVLFRSDFFKAEDIRYEKVKGPAEFVTGVLRLTGEFDRPHKEINERYEQTNFMGQMLTNPPSVEGWRQGVDWIETGTLIERINFVSEQFGDLEKPGVRDMVDGIMAESANPTPNELIDLCVERLGFMSVSDETRDVLLRVAQEAEHSPDKVAQVLRLTATTHEFQRA